MFVQAKKRVLQNDASRTDVHVRRDARGGDAYVMARTLAPDMRAPIL